MTNAPMTGKLRGWRGVGEQTPNQAARAIARAEAKRARRKARNQQLHAKQAKQES